MEWVSRLSPSGVYLAPKFKKTVDGGLVLASVSLAVAGVLDLIKLGEYIPIAYNVALVVGAVGAVGALVVLSAAELKAKVGN